MKVCHQLANFLLFLFGLYAVQGQNLNTPDNSFEVKLDASWKASPFQLSLLESIAGHNETLFIRTLSKIIGFSFQEEDLDDESEETDEVRKPDSHTYKRVFDALTLDATSKAFIDFNLVNKIYTPRIQAHYDYYSNVVEPEFSTRLIKECSIDSFGNKILSSKSDIHQSWLIYNNKLYCSPDEVFALQTDNTASSEDILPFDRVISFNNNAPFLVLYGDIESESFKKMFRNLYESAKSGKLRFAWRYIPPSNINEYELLSGYGSDLTLKRTDYTVIDDRDIAKNKKEDKHNFKSTGYKLNKDLWKIAETEELKPVPKVDIKELGLKLTSFVLSNDYKNISNFELLNLLLQDFPKYAHYVSQLAELKNIQSVRENVNENDNLGISEDSNGIYINGSPINKLELDVIKLVEKIEEELKSVTTLKSLGFSVAQAKKLISKFSLLSAVKEAQFRKGNSIMGGNENRFKLYNYQFKPGQKHKKGGIVFFNDMENDNEYQGFSSDRSDTYSDGLIRRLRPGQIPPLRENIHELIFALNLSNKGQLEVFFALSKVILDKSIPQQLGLIALDGSEKDKILAEKFYMIVDKATVKEAFAFLYKYFEADNEKKEQELLDLVVIPSNYNFNQSVYQDVLNKFSINEPSIICNGVIHELRSTWQASMGRQITQDVRLIQRYIKNGVDNSKPLKSLLFENAKTERNLRIIPTDPRLVKYKGISQELIDKSITFRTNNAKDDVSVSLWLIGDFDSVNLISQFIDILRIMKVTRSYSIQVRVLSTSKSGLLKKLLSEFPINNLESHHIKKLISFISSQENSEVLNERNNEVIQLLESHELPMHHSFLLLNSRYLRLDDNLTSRDLETLLEYEVSQRLDIFKNIFSAYPNDFSLNSICEYSPTEQNCLDWFDLVSSYITKSFHVDDTLFIPDVARFDFNSLNMNNILEISDNDDSTTEVDILLCIDPIDEYSQKLVSIVRSIANFPFVNIKILLQPQVEESEELKIKRFYRGVYPPSIPKFNSKGNFEQDYKGEFKSLPSLELFTNNIDPPARWQVVIKESPQGVDLDNIKLSNYEGGLIYGTYTLKNVLIEGYANNVGSLTYPSGLSLELNKGDLFTDTTVMSNLGYFQLQANPGIWKFKIKSDSKSERHFSLLSASENRFVANTTPLDSDIVSILNLRGLVLRPRFISKEGYEGRSLFDGEDDEESKGNKVSNFMQSILKSTPSNSKKQADVNIFTIASGHLYERFLSIMTLSVRTHTDKLVKFWIIENYISSHFKRLLPLLSQKYNFEYELITYKWPNWLRFQREKQRTIWGYKILFLDVIFPQDLKKVIFVDADQVIRTDMKELVDIDLQGAPYGFVPMCDSRKEMEGFRFWKQGYWADVLKDGLKYHISALFVVDLEKFRTIQAGDKLRTHYQRLSSDSNSLSNLDQDLPNNLQNQLKIHSLPQEWLWCETWCADNELSKARTIDLCNNPLTKENKLERAKRQIPEWSSYDDQVNSLIIQSDKEQEKSDKSDDTSDQSATSEYYEKDQVESQYEYDYDYEHDEL